MGFNTVVVVMNDAIHMIEEDQSWGKRLAGAVRGFYGLKRQGRNSSIPARPTNGMGVFSNSAEIISQQHADGYQIVVVHRNTGWEITNEPDDGVPDHVIKAVEWTLKARRAALKKQKASQT